eukprot:10698444-Lingulodinium_polyedra.AAC.1
MQSLEEANFTGVPGVICRIGAMYVLLHQHQGGGRCLPAAPVPRAERTGQQGGDSPADVASPDQQKGVDHCPPL